MSTTTVDSTTDNYARPPFAAGTRVYWEVAGTGRAIPVVLTGVVSSRTELARDGVRIPDGYTDHTPVHDGAGVLWPRTARLRLTPARSAA